MNAASATATTSESSEKEQAPSPTKASSTPKAEPPKRTVSPQRPQGVAPPQTASLSEGSPQAAKPRAKPQTKGTSKPQGRGSGSQAIEKPKVSADTSRTDVPKPELPVAPTSKVKSVKPKNTHSGRTVNAETTVGASKELSQNDESSKFILSAKPPVEGCTTECVSNDFKVKDETVAEQTLPTSCRTSPANVTLKFSTSPTSSPVTLTSDDLTVRTTAQSDCQEQTIPALSSTHETDFVSVLSGESKKPNMSEATDKLDHLCRLLENITVQYEGKDAVINNVKLPQHIKTKTPAAAELEVKTAPTAVNPPVTVSETKGGEKTREELELERKARKEAKKARKKDGKKEKEQDKENQKDSKNANVQKDVPEKKPVLSQGDAQVNQKPLKQTVSTKMPTEPLGTSQVGSAEKSKADLKRERREKQEAQRQAKAAAQAQQAAEKQQKPKEQVQRSGDKVQQTQNKKTGKNIRLKSGKSLDKGSGGRRIPFLGHLTPYSSSPPPQPVNVDSIHPAIRALGIKMKVIMK